MQENLIKQLSDLINIDVTILTLLSTVIITASSAWKYFDLRAREQRQKNFENYHNLLQLISEGKKEGELLKSVSQRAYIFELRNFPQYKELSIRLLLDLVNDWENAHKYDKLTFEVNETIKQLNKKTSFMGIKLWF